MFKNIFLWSWIVLTLAIAPLAYAGKLELTTYYPAPTGEYSEVQTAQKLKVPVVTAGTKTIGNTTAGEIWVECPAGQTWNGSACV